eukprot:1732993-Ditylum_brightwellii.AAC.1
MAVHMPSVEEITKNFCHTILPQIIGQPTYERIYKIHKLLMENAATMDTTVGGGAHGHLGLVLTGQHYLQLTGGKLCITKQSWTKPGTTKSLHGASQVGKSPHNSPPTADNVSEVP